MTQAQQTFFRPSVQPTAFPAPRRVDRECDVANHSGRWTAERKVALLNAIDTRELTLEEACVRYGFSIEEIALWRARYAAQGVQGLMNRALKERRL